MKVAEGFANLLEVTDKSIEDGGGDVVAPRHFKRMIGDIAPQFQGYDQHDSQVMYAHLYIQLSLSLFHSFSLSLSIKIPLLHSLSHSLSYTLSLLPPPI